MLQKKKWLPIAILFLLLVIAAGGWLAWRAYSLNVIPLKYLLIGCGAVAVLILITALFLFAGLGKEPKISRRVTRIIGIILSVLFSAVFFLLAQCGTKAYYSAEAVVEKTGIIQEELDLAISNIQDEKFEDATAQIGLIDSNAADVKETLSKNEWAILSKLPVIGQNVEAENKLIDAFQEVSDDVLKPAVSYLSQAPLSGFAGDISMETLGSDMPDKLDIYADMLDELVPNAEQFVTDFGNIPAFTISEMEEQISEYRGTVSDLGEVIPQLDGISDSIIRPLADTLRKTPLSSLNAGNGLNVNVLITYLDLIENAQPGLEGISETLDDHKDNEFLSGISEKLAPALELTASLEEYIPVIRAVVGDGSDRTYLVVAQNTAEYRACGGFPGSVGMMTIRDGILWAGDFTSVVNYIPEFADHPFYADENENRLFTWIADSKIRDAGWNPHFPKVAGIWADGFKAMYGMDVNGVIALTPHIIQDLLAVIGPVTLSNGAELNGQNATKFLQYDLYYSFYTEQNYVSEEYINGLFSETADAIVLQLIANLEPDRLADIFRVFREAADEREFMIWMSDEKEQQTIVSEGYSGSLNSDPEAPEIGVFYSVLDGDKVGWFVGIDTVIGDGVPNGDGTISYPVNVTLSDRLTAEAIEAYHAYNPANMGNLIGSYDGALNSLIYFFAPAGGMISDLANSAGLESFMTEYNGLQVGSYLEFMVAPSSSVDFSFTVTTAPGVDTVPVFKTTPLLQDYWE